MMLWSEESLPDGHKPTICLYEVILDLYYIFYYLQIPLKGGPFFI